MPKFGDRSRKNLSEAHPDLQRLFNEVIKHFDCSVIEGHRPKEKQDEAFHAGRSKVQWPNSKHNSTPSMAVDVVPYYGHRKPSIDWNDTAAFYMFVGFVRGIASQMGIKIRCGADWNGDNDLKDQNFHDLPHFELVSASSNGIIKTDTDYLPDGPTEDDINVTLEDIERSTLGDF